MREYKIKPACWMNVESWVQALWAHYDWGEWDGCTTVSFVGAI